ncbi:MULTISPECIES: hypothetical protein [unclassified Nostoc]|uniref:hypothetical protein n=1 Tax=unclassified Nostoc TaxID=2593658 RepID=UPI0013D009BD|nr:MULTISPECIES: hypothetical protein [unclassified Nostoc]MBE9000177.1 hypothetical protein [Nostoc sp. LEGE 12447]NEU79285.1 hypothetical protein [Nostoc sp. UIC 10630]
MINSTSTIDELIQKQNPFAGHLVVKPQQIWGKSFPDVPSINVHASNAVFDAIDKIQKGQRSTVGITIVAERGLGKSHIISRIRHHLQAETNSLFIYMSKYDNLNQIKYEFLQSVASSLRAFGSQKVMQWQEIAAALINEAKQWNYTPQQYISQYPTWLNKHSTKLVEQFTKLVLSIKPEISNPYIVKAILWTLSPVHINYANRWLSGLEITQEEAEEMGLPNLNKEDRETESLRNIRQILDITSYYRIPVICFDELDNADVAENGLTTAQVIASLVKDLYNNLKRGVFLSAMYPETWNEQIRLLPQAEAVIDRLVSEEADRQPIELKYLNSDDIISLVKGWLQDFYQENQQIPPHFLYPFDENKLRQQGKERPTVRSILKWCADNFLLMESIDCTTDINQGFSEKNQIKSNIDFNEKESVNVSLVETYFQKELVEVNQVIDELLEDEVAISNALRLSIYSLIGETIEGVTIESLEEVEPTAVNNGFMDFKIIGKMIGKRNKLRIGVDVVQQDGANVGAALKRLIDYETFNLTRGCLVRTNVIRQAATVARDRLRILLDKRKGGKWVALESEDIQPLLAILWVYWGSENYGIKEEKEILDFQEQVLDFIKQRKIAMNNPLIREIISPPSYDNWVDNEFPISIPKPIATTDNIDLNL